MNADRIPIACRTALVAAAVLIGLAAFAQTPQDSVVRDPATGDWVYTLYNPEDQRSHVWRYTPRNRFVPAIGSGIQASADGYVYRYRIANGASAKQHLQFAWLRGFFTIPAGLLPPRGNAETMPTAELLDRAIARLDANKKLRAQYMTTLPLWNADWNLDAPDYTEYGWFAAGGEDHLGVAPGRLLTGFSIRRPELPGAAFAETQGFVLDSYILGGLPETGPIAEAVEKMIDEDSLWVPVLVPAFALSTPYDGAEHMRRLREHVQRWLKWELITADALVQLNRQFDVLLPALQARNTDTARQMLLVIMTQARAAHPTLSDTDIDEEDDLADDARAMPPRGRATLATAPGMHRIAARVLLFNARYLLARLPATTGG